MIKNFFLTGLTSLLLSCSTQKLKPDITSLKIYHKQLEEFRNEFRVIEMPDVKFFLFGMGNRTKLLYKEGKLINSFTNEIVKKWRIQKETIIPNAFKVELTTINNQFVVIYENELGVFIEENDKKTLIKNTNSQINLPTFADYKYSEILKVLHQEILINIVDSKPIPNYFVYKNPWRRDAAMMALCFEHTDNIDLLKDWVLSIDDPYDHNNIDRKTNIPENEADNLGQTLFLLSYFTDKNHPMVSKTLKEVEKFIRSDSTGKYILGRSDFQEVPGYQTKWLKLGLERLGLKDDYTIPKISCNYTTLFWMDYTDYITPGNDLTNDNYPYIGWARDHTYKTKTSPISNRDYPLTWEINASSADYSKMNIIDKIYVNEKNSSPHTWHAAEIFLYLLDTKMGYCNEK